MSVALAFPGQGGDWKDLLAIIHEHGDDPLVAHLADVLGTTAFDELDAGDTGVAQPCLFVASLLSARTAQDPAAAVIGHSMGELTAATHASSFTPEHGLELVAERARLGAARQDERQGQMLAIMRVPAAEVEWIRRRAVADAGGVLELAVVNGREQAVLAGDRDTAERARTLADEAGAVARPLPIGGAFHSPLLVPAVEPYEAAIRAAQPAAPSVPLVLSTSAAAVSEVDDLVRQLARALVLPVRWLEALTALAELGVERVVDVGPGRTLANLADHDRVLPFDGLREGRRTRR